MESAFATTYDFVTKYMLIASHWMLIPTIVVMIIVIVLGVLWFGKTVLPIFLFIGSLVSVMFLEYLRADPQIFQYSPVFHSFCILMLLVTSCYLGTYFIMLRVKYGAGKSIFIPQDAAGPKGAVGKEGPPGRQGQPGREGQPGSLSNEQETLLFDAHRVLEMVETTAPATDDDLYTGSEGETGLDVAIKDATPDPYPEDEDEKPKSKSDG